MDKIVLLITSSSKKEASNIANALVDQKLVACVNITAEVMSVFSWKGKTENENEVMMICKSSLHLFDDIVALVKKMHSYETPEIIALPIIAGAENYLAWIDKTIRV